MNDATSYPYRPIEFGELLARSWQITLRSGRSLLLGLGLLLPLSVGVDGLGRSVLLDLAHYVTLYGIPDESTSPETLAKGMAPMLGSSFGYFALVLLYIGALLFVQTSATAAAWEAISGYNPAGERGLQRPFWYNLMQTIMLGIILLMAYIATELLRAAGGAIAPMFESLVLVAAGMVAAYFGVVTAFRVHELVVDGRGVHS